MIHQLLLFIMRNADLTRESTINSVKFVLKNSNALERIIIHHCGATLQSTSVEDDLLQMDFASDNVLVLFEPFQISPRIRM